jgi:SAM-dependent methyltransferase
MKKVVKTTQNSKAVKQKKEQIKFHKNSVDIDTYVRNPENQILKVKKIVDLIGISSFNRVLCIAPGEELLFFENSDSRIIAIDISKEMLERSKKLFINLNLNIDYMLADAESLPFKEGIFDLSFGIAFLHHVFDPKEVLSEMYYVTKKYGYIGASEPNMCNLLNIYNFIVGYPYDKGVLRSRPPIILNHAKYLKMSDIKTYYLIISPRIGYKFLDTRIKNILEILKQTILSKTLAISIIYAFKK